MPVWPFDQTDDDAVTHALPQKKHFPQQQNVPTDQQPQMLLRQKKHWPEDSETVGWEKVVAPAEEPLPPPGRAPVSLSTLPENELGRKKRLEHKNTPALRFDVSDIDGATASTSFKLSKLDLAPYRKSLVSSDMMIQEHPLSERHVNPIDPTYHFDGEVLEPCAHHPKEVSYVNKPTYAFVTEDVVHGNPKREITTFRQSNFIADIDGAHSGTVKRGLKERNFSFNPVDPVYPSLSACGSPVPSSPAHSQSLGSPSKSHPSHPSTARSSQKGKLASPGGSLPPSSHRSRRSSGIEYSKPPRLGAGGSAAGSNASFHREDSAPILSPRRSSIASSRRSHASNPGEGSGGHSRRSAGSGGHTGGMSPSSPVKPPSSGRRSHRSSRDPSPRGATAGGSGVVASPSGGGAPLSPIKATTQLSPGPGSPLKSPSVYGNKLPSEMSRRSATGIEAAPSSRSQYLASKGSPAHKPSPTPSHRSNRDMERVKMTPLSGSVGTGGGGDVPNAIHQSQQRADIDPSPQLERQITASGAEVAQVPTPKLDNVIQPTEPTPRKPTNPNLMLNLHESKSFGGGVATLTGPKSARKPNSPLPSEVKLANEKQSREMEEHINSVRALA